MRVYLAPIIIIALIIAAIIFFVACSTDIRSGFGCTSPEQEKAALACLR